MSDKVRHDVSGLSVRVAYFKEQSSTSEAGNCRTWLLTLRCVSNGMQRCSMIKLSLSRSRHFVL